MAIVDLAAALAARDMEALVARADPGGQDAADSVGQAADTTAKPGGCVLQGASNQPRPTFCLFQKFGFLDFFNI